MAASATQAHKIDRIVNVHMSIYSALLNLSMQIPETQEP